MTKKKTTPHPKKVETKKKEAKPTWKQTGEANIPGLGTIKNFDVKFTQDTSPSAQDILDAVTAENYALKQLLSKKQENEMPQGKPSGIIQPTRNMDSQLGELDGQLSRFYNGMNILDGFADRLKANSLSSNGQPMAPAPGIPSDIFGKLDYMLSTLGHLNNRLEATNNYLSEII